MTLKIVEDITAFHRAGEVPMPERLGIPPRDRTVLRWRLIREEVEETLDAIYGDNLVEIADGIADSIVVLVGTALEYGIDLTAVWNEVCRSNMAKFPPCEKCDGDGIHEGVKTNDLELYDPDTGEKRVCQYCNGRGTQLRLRDDGKILKPEGWTPPDIAGVLDRQ